MYEIRPESIKTFITDRNIKLPRFQRKQTWDAKKNFQLCVSLFKEYPIGVTILSVEESKGKTIRWLLDGRQRRNALIQMREDPENIYNWAKAFIGFKNSDQPFELEEKFNTKINEYIEADLEEDVEEQEISIDTSEGLDDDDEPKLGESNYGLDFLLDIIKIIHNKQKKNTGFTKPFDFTKYVDKLPYVNNDGQGVVLVSKGVKTFIDEYRNYCDNNELNYEEEASFYMFVDSRSIIKNENKLRTLLGEQWSRIKERILIVEKIDDLLSSCKIGVIEVKNLSPSDSQKIFNIINSEGEKLTAVEILSAKPHWNIPVGNLSEKTIEIVKDLYRKIGTNQEDVVRWDLPATLIRQIGNNFVFKRFTDTKTDFEKELTCGFKVMACVYVGGVKKDHIEALSKSPNINWNSDPEEFARNLSTMLKLISSFDYFKYFKSWKSSLMEITADAVALDFVAEAYKDWIRKGCPIGGDSVAKQFQKNCFILWDKLIYEHAYKQWRGASDQKIANNVAALEYAPAMFTQIESDKWKKLLDEIFDGNTIESQKITQAMMEPLLYHFYCLRRIQGPDTEYMIEVDHIIPKTVFNESGIKDKDIIQNNILNLGLLPKDENISKGNRRLVAIESAWLRDQVTKYEFIDIDDFMKFSDVTNYLEMYEGRKKYFYEAFGKMRDDIINN